MKRVHILTHTLIVKSTNVSYTSILGVYSSAKKTRLAYEKEIAQDTNKLGDKVIRSEEYMTGCHIIETDKNYRYHTIYAKQLQ